MNLYRNGFLLQKLHTKVMIAYIIYVKKVYNQYTMTDQKDPFPKIKADDLDTIITFLDDLRGSSSVGGSMVTSGDLGR